MARTKAKYTRWKVFYGYSDCDGLGDRDYDGGAKKKDDTCYSLGRPPPPSVGFTGWRVFLSTDEADVGVQ